MLNKFGVEKTKDKKGKTKVVLCGSLINDGYYL
jgi:hypothetical protein